MPGSRARRVGAGLVALANLGGAVFLALLGLLANGMRCDDNCGVGAPGWRNDPNAWQWSAELYIGLAVLAGALLLNVSAWLRRGQWAALVSMAVQVAALVFLTVLSATAEPATHTSSDWLVSLFVFFVATGVGSARLAAAQRDD